MNEDRFGVSAVQKMRTLQFARNILAANALWLAMEGYKPRPLTRREKVAGWFAEWRWRVSEAWYVLRTGDHREY